MARHPVLIALSLLLTFFIAGCGLDNATTAAPNNTTVVVVTPTAMAGDNGMMNATPTAIPGNQPMKATPTAMAGDNGMMNATPTSMPGNQSMKGDPNAFIQTMKVMINGNAVMVLTTNKGMVLYYRRSDPAPDSGCTAMCAKAWPPLLAPANMMNVTSAVTLPKQLTVHMTANGNQVEYDGHPLYTYASDMTPGQFTGRGMDNVWFLVGINL